MLQNEIEGEEFMYTQPAPTETQPGLLNVFQFLGWLQIAISGVYLVIMMGLTKMAIIGLWVPLLSAGVLLWVITSSAVQAKLGKLHLPVALTFAVIHVIVLYGLLWQQSITVPILTKSFEITVLLDANTTSTIILVREALTSFALVVVLTNLFFSRFTS